MTDSIRAEFNTWWDRQPFNAQFEDVRDQMFNVWVASRAECVVEIPQLREVIYGRRENEHDSGFNTAIDLCFDAIESAGLKLKP